MNRLLESFTRLNWLDYTVLGVLVAFVVAGCLKGLLRQLLQIVGIVVALVLAARLTATLSRQPGFDSLRNAHQDAPVVTAYIAIFLATVAVASVLINLLPTRRDSGDAFQPADRVLGGIFGAAKGVLLLGGLCIGAMQLRDLGESPTFSQSVIAPRMIEGCQSLAVLLPAAPLPRDKGEAPGELTEKVEKKSDRSELRAEQQTLHLDPGKDAREPNPPEETPPTPTDSESDP